MIRFNIKNYDYVDSKISGEVQRFRINAPDEKSTFAAGKGKWGLLDWRGEELVGAIYDKINPFKEHLALTKKGKKYGYLDDKGRIAVDFIYENGTDFKNGVALVEKSGTSFYIDYLGEKIKKPKFKNEDENKAEIIPFRKDSPLWYKKISNSFVSVLYFKEDEEDKPIKFKTKIAADEEKSNDLKITQFFAFCLKFFNNKDKTSLGTKLTPTNPLVIDIPSNLKMIELKLGPLRVLELDPADLDLIVKGDAEKAAPLLEKINKLDPSTKKTLLGLMKSLGVEADLSEPELTENFNGNYLWTYNNSTKTLMIGDKKIEDTDSNNTYFYPKTKDEPYYFIRLPDAMVVFTRDKG